MSYNEYVDYSRYLTALYCELNNDWVFVEPVVRPGVDQEEKIRECIKDNMPSFAEIDRYFYFADLSDDGYLNIDELLQIYN